MTAAPSRLIENAAEEINMNCFSWRERRDLGRTYFYMVSFSPRLRPPRNNRVKTRLTRKYLRRKNARRLGVASSPSHGQRDYCIPRKKKALEPLFAYDCNTSPVFFFADSRANFPQSRKCISSSCSKRADGSYIWIITRRHWWPPSWRTIESASNSPTVCRSWESTVKMLGILNI